MRRLITTFLVALAAGGCAYGPPVRLAAPPPGAAGYPMDPAAGRENEKDEDAEGADGGRERAALISAEYNLRIEHDENGPPTVAQILRANGHRKVLLAAPAPRAKSAGLPAVQWPALRTPRRGRAPPAH